MQRADESTGAPVGAFASIERPRDEASEWRRDVVPPVAFIGATVSLLSPPIVMSAMSIAFETLIVIWLSAPMTFFLIALQSGSRGRVLSQ